MFVSCPDFNPVQGIECELGYELTIPDISENRSTVVENCTTWMTLDPVCFRMEVVISLNVIKDAQGVYMNCHPRSNCTEITCDDYKDTLLNYASGIQADEVLIKSCEVRCCDTNSCNGVIMNDSPETTVVTASESPDLTTSGTKIIAPSFAIFIAIMLSVYMEFKFD
ncbi:uncharacterized protein LOC120341744 [Styela clava]